MRDDFRHTYRRLRHQPTFVAAIVTVLSLAIAAVTIVIVVADAVILGPYPAADRVAVIWAPDGRRVLEK